MYDVQLDYSRFPYSHFPGKTFPHKVIFPESRFQERDTESNC